MTKSYLIGLGGTGAKCLESYIHLAAAGLAEGETWIGMVDQDESNGNVGRTKNLLRSYEVLRTGLRSGENDLGQSQLFKTNISFPSEVDGIRGSVAAVWAPASGVRNLPELFSESLMVPDLRSLFHTFFDQEDRQTELDVGFRGRPYLGATALQSRSLSGSAFWDDLMGSLDMARSGLKVRIFLVASIFGGTGAAGLPIMARKLWERVKNMDNGDSFKVGCCMMLPYFSFPQVQGGTVCTNAADFLGQTQGALKYYHELFNSDEFDKRKLFDSVYFVGWDPLIKLDYEKVGNWGQENPSMLPEIYAALAAARFFASDEGGYFYTSRPADSALSWSSLPYKNNGGQQDASLMQGLGTLTRFAFAYLCAYAPYLTKRGHGAFAKQPWYKKLIAGRGVDLSDEATAEIIGNLSGYCSEMLRWMAALCHYPLGEENHAELAQAMAFSLRPEKALSGQPVLRSAAEFERKAFGELIHGASGGDLAQVFEQLNQGKQPEKTAGLGCLLGSLFDACVVR